MQIGKCRFDRMELAGSLGDLGTLLPLAIGMIVVNGLSPGGLFFAVGLFYVLAGTYYKVPVAVQPMKVISAYAISTGAAAIDIQAAALLMALALLAIGLTDVMAAVVRFIPKPVIRGVQASTGVMLASQGTRFMAGTSDFQKMQGAAEPFLGLPDLWFLPLGLVIGLGFAALTLLLLNNKKFPAGLAVVVGGLVLGLLLGGWKNFAGFEVGLNLPNLLPFGLPGWATLGLVMLTMVLPQAPMTLGNAVIANADLSMNYFPQGTRVTPRALCLSMAGANALAFLLGGMPMCHGAGGLAAHYRFGARTAGSNYIIGAIFLALAVLLGHRALAVLQLLPMAVMGVLLVFAGLQLCLTVIDIQARRGLFTVFLMVTITLAFNLAVAFVVGAVVANVLKAKKIEV